MPGFRSGDAAPWLAERMAGAGWTIGASCLAILPKPAPNRIEWDFELLPYAGGEVRRFFPMGEARGAMDVHLQGRHHLISAEAKLFSTANIRP